MIVTRFAPSPTGYLHLGHAFAAFTAWRRARSTGGRFLLRLEDIDPIRCKPEFSTAIQDDLLWLGLDWDGVPRKQSQHLAEYKGVLDQLVERQLAYPCFCTRAEIFREVTASISAPHGPDGAPLYPGTCQRLSQSERQTRIAAGDRFVIRLNMAAVLQPNLAFEDKDGTRIACQPEKFGDVVLARKDSPTSYHLCATHDDALQGVTMVTRGVDLEPATAVHRLLQAIMGWPSPRYGHHKLLLDATGKRLAKRDEALTLRSLRAEGVPARAIIRQLENQS